MPGAESKATGGRCRMPLDTDPSLHILGEAELVFASACTPGIRREKLSDGSFCYRREDGGRLSKADLARAEALKVPPAWEDVWICGDARGHLQATGRDSRGRKQYRYHDGWIALRDQNKFGHLIEFGEALPSIRGAVDQNLRRPTLDVQRALAVVVAVMDDAFVRVGNAQYVRDNESFGLTTLRDEHADVGARSVRLHFRGKAGKDLDVCVENPRIARAVRRMRDLPGQELFQYFDANGVQRVVESSQVNAYLQQIAARPVTSKDFRTWGGSLAAALALHAAAESPASERVVTQAVRQAADLLGNTPAVCRRSYIHPGILDLYRSGRFEVEWHAAEKREPSREHLRDDERVFLGLLRRL